MTELDKFIIQFEDHIDDIFTYKEHEKDKTQGIIRIGYPKKGYSEYVNRDGVNYPRNGYYATEEVIRELKNISFIEILDLPGLQFLGQNKTIASPFLGIKIIKNAQNENWIMSRVETENYTHIAALYECIKRLLNRNKGRETDKYTIIRNQKNVIIEQTITIFENWALEKNIARKKNFCKIESQSIHDSLGDKVDEENEIDFNPFKDFSFIKLGKKKININKVLMGFIKFLFKDYSDGEIFRGSEMIKYYNRCIGDSNNKKYTGKKISGKNIPEAFRNQDKTNGKLLVDNLFDTGLEHKLIRDEYKIKSIYCEQYNKYQNISKDPTI
jgi:hypothetical protein